MGFHLASLLFSYFQSKCHLWSLPNKTKKSSSVRGLFLILYFPYHSTWTRTETAGPIVPSRQTQQSWFNSFILFTATSYSNRILSQFYIYLAAACSVVMSQYDLLCLSQLWPQHQRGNVIKNYEGIFVLKGVSDSTRYLAENSALERKFNIFLSFEIFP